MTPHDSLQELHDLARKGQHLYAVTKDPLTAAAVELLFTTRTPKAEPAQHAATMLRTQLQAYSAIHVEPLPE